MSFFLGWWLSMDPKDSFLKKIQPIRDIASLMDRQKTGFKMEQNPKKLLEVLL